MKYTIRTFRKGWMAVERHAARVFFFFFRKFAGQSAVRGKYMARWKTPFSDCVRDLQRIHTYIMHDFIARERVSDFIPAPFAQSALPPSRVLIHVHGCVFFPPSFAFHLRVVLLFMVRCDLWRETLRRRWCGLTTSDDDYYFILFYLFLCNVGTVIIAVLAVFCCCFFSFFPSPSILISTQLFFWKIYASTRTRVVEKKFATTRISSPRLRQ